jgi:YD repeat-containing protein
VRTRTYLEARWSRGSCLPSLTDQNGTEIDQGFDDLDRLTARELTLATGVGGDTNESFEYDALNRLTEAADDDSIVQLTYDSLSRVLTEVQGANPLGTTGKTVVFAKTVSASSD